MNVTNHPPDGTGCPTIEPVQAGCPRPFWSVMIPVYNDTRFLEQALKSVLRQDPGPGEMQIEVVDDASLQGDSERITATAGGGRVSFHRHRSNLGLANNFTACVRRSLGRVVHILHQDDFVLPGFYQPMRRRIEEHPECGLFMGRAMLVDSSGRVVAKSPRLHGTSGVQRDYYRLLSRENRALCPSVLVRREVYERGGGFEPGLNLAVDWEMWMRASGITWVWCEDRPLTAYRRHPEQTSARFRSDAIGESRAALSYVAGRLPLPTEDQARFHREALRFLARLAMYHALAHLSIGRFRDGREFIREAYACHPSWPILFVQGLGAGCQGLLRKGLRRLAPPGREDASLVE